MRKIPYKIFSLRTHKRSWKINRPNLCQFELTFGCGLHCSYCHTDCYNRPGYLKKELKTKDVKSILDKVLTIGASWLCFTGGDPLTRRDFLDIYSYAKNKGFIITIFTNAYSMTKEIARYFKESPPFVIETTLNAVTEGLYEKISQVKGSFERTMRGINLILETGLPLKIKTQVIRDNLEEFPKIKEFVKGLGLEFRYSTDLNARLNGDLAPCKLRILPEEVLGLNGRQARQDYCRYGNLFPCAIASGDGFHIDPYGNIFLCELIRKSGFNLLNADIEYAFDKLLYEARNRRFTGDSKCKCCDSVEFCSWCPGRAYLETEDMEASITYYCRLAKDRKNKEC